MIPNKKRKWSVQVGNRAMFVYIEAKNVIEAINKALKHKHFQGLNINDVFYIELIE